MLKSQSSAIQKTKFSITEITKCVIYNMYQLLYGLPEIKYTFDEPHHSKYGARPQERKNIMISRISNCSIIDSNTLTIFKQNMLINMNLFHN